MRKLQIHPTGAALGSEIRGVDLSEPLSPEKVSLIRRALLDHGVLFFRGQTLTEADQVRFTRYFGKPVPHVRKQPERATAEIFIISNVTADGKPIGALGNDEIAFHSDLSYMPKPGTISILYAIEVPDEGGDTYWANAVRSYEALDSALKARTATLDAVHRHPEAAQNPKTPAVHPIARVHPETGRTVLYVNPHFTQSIVGLPEAEGRALLEKLLEHACDPRFVYRHRWRAGDLVMWDNRSTMHRRDGFDGTKRRIMKRTQMFGEATY